MANADLTVERRANRDHEHRCGVVEALLAPAKDGVISTAQKVCAADEPV